MDKFLPEMHLKQPGFTCSVCGLFTKNKERILKKYATGDASYIYNNDLNKSGLQHDITYGKNKDLTKRPKSDKVLRDKAFVVASKYDGYSSMVYKFLDKISTGSDNKSIPGQQLANELHKPIIRRLKEEKYILLLKTIFGMLI